MSYQVTVAIDWDNDGSFATAGDDITAYVIGCQISAGFTDELRHVADIGQCYLTLDNQDRRFSPQNSSGPYYGKLLPSRPIRVSASDGVTTWELWTGTLKRIMPQPGSGGSRECLIVGEDGLTKPQMETVDLPFQVDITADRLLRLVTSHVWRGGLASLAVVFHDQPRANDTIPVHGYSFQFYRTYKFVTALTPTANEVLIGATKEATAANLAGAINNDPDLAGSGYAATTVRSELVSAGNVASGTMHAGSTTTITASGGTALVIGNNGVSQFEAAQSFTLSAAGKLSQIKIRHGANGGTPSGTMTYIITHNSSFSSTPPQATSPKLTYLATGTYTPTASAENVINISGSDYLPDDTTLRLWLFPTNTQSSGNYWTWQTSATSTYANGQCADTINGGYTWSAKSYDAQCEITASACTDANLTLTALARGAEGNSIYITDAGLGDVVGGYLTGGTDAPAGLLSTQLGSRSFQLCGDAWAQEDVNAWRALESLVNSEFGYLWVARDGTLTLKNKNWEFSLHTVTPAMTVTNTATNIDPELDDALIINKVSVDYIPKTQISNGVVAQSLGVIEVPGYSFNQGDTTVWPRNNRAATSYAGTASAPAGKPKSGDKLIRLAYTDENGIRIGARDLITPVAGTDYTVNDESDGSGFNYTPTGRIKIALAPSGSDVEISFKNSASGPLYVRNLVVRGTQIAQYSPETLVVSDDDSIEDYGTHPYSFSLEMGADPIFAEAVAYYLLARYGQPRQAVHTLIFEGPEVIGGVNILSLDVGSVIALTDTQTAITSEKYYVRGLAYTLAQGGQMVNAQFTLKRLESFAVAILDDPVYGVLDAANCLGL